MASGCWLWTGSYFPAGYGQVWSRKLQRVTQAHRLAYETLVGPIPDGLTIDHLCRVRGCVNPDHLRVVTQRENVHAPGSLCVAAANAKKEACHKGHPLAAENLYVSRGRRYCRACKRAEKRARRISARENRPTRAAAANGRGGRCNAGTSAFAVQTVSKPDADGCNPLGIR